MTRRCATKLWNVWLWIKLFCRWGRKWEWKFLMSSWIRRLLTLRNRTTWRWIRCAAVWLTMDWTTTLIVTRFAKRWLFLKCVTTRCVVALLFCCRKLNSWRSRWVTKTTPALSWTWATFWFCCWKTWLLIRWTKRKARRAPLLIRRVTALILVSWRLLILPTSRRWTAARWAGAVFRSCPGFLPRH